MNTDLTDNARREIAHLTRHAEDTRLDPAERAAALLTAHQRWDAGGCLCGWDEFGMSHALHQADVLAGAGLLVAADHHARLAAGTEEGFLCGAFQPLGLLAENDQVAPYRCTEPHNHRGPHKAVIDGKDIATWGRL